MKKPKNVADFTVIVDSREQNPFTFQSIPADSDEGGGPSSPDATLSIPTRRLCLPVGDYSIFGLPSIIIERKSKEDLYSSISSTKKRANFESRLSRMCSEYAFSAVVIEAEWSSILFNPPKFTEFSPKALYRTILAWRIRYPLVHWEPAPDRDAAEVMTFRMLDRFWEACTKSPGDFAMLAALDRRNGIRRPFGYAGVKAEGQPEIYTPDELAAMASMTEANVR